MSPGQEPPEDPAEGGTGDWPAGWADDWPGDEDTPPSWFAGQHLPPDARRMGLNHTVPDGALLDFAGSLDSTKTLHRVTAWVMLAVFSAPAVFYVLRLVRDLNP